MASRPITPNSTPNKSDAEPFDLVRKIDRIAIFRDEPRTLSPRPKPKFACASILESDEINTTNIIPKCKLPTANVQSGPENVFRYKYPINYKNYISRVERLMGVPASIIISTKRSKFSGANSHSNLFTNSIRKMKNEKKTPTFLQLAQRKWASFNWSTSDNKSENSSTFSNISPRFRKYYMDENQTTSLRSTTASDAGHSPCPRSPFQWFVSDGDTNPGSKQSSSKNLHINDQALKGLNPSVASSSTTPFKVVVEPEKKEEDRKIPEAESKGAIKKIPSAKISGLPKSKSNNDDASKKKTFKGKSKDKTSDKDKQKKSVYAFLNVKKYFLRKDEDDDQSSSEALAEKRARYMLRNENQVAVDTLSMFLVVPKSSVLPEHPRSRSMNNIDSLLSSNYNWYDKYRWTSIAYDFGKFPTPFSISSMPEISTHNLKGIKSRRNTDVLRRCVTNLQVLLDDWPYLRETSKEKAQFQLKRSRSQGSPREYFELIIPKYVIAKSALHTKPYLITNVLYIPAKKNICLSDMLDYTVSAYFSVNKYNYFLRGSSTPLNEKFVDSWTLAGKIIEIKERMHSNDKLKINILKDTKKNKANYFSKSADDSVSRKSGSGFIMNTPTETKGRSTGVTQKFNQLMSLFGNKNDSLEMERLEAKLLEMGDDIPRMPIYTPFPMSMECADALLTVESRNVEKIFNINELSPIEVLQQRALYEILATEASYINHIKTAVEIFYSAAYAIQEEGIMTNIDTDRLFYNIAEVLNSNLRLWAQFFYPMLEEAVLTRQKFNPESFYQGLARFEEIFAPYENFVLHQMKIQNYSRYMMQTNPVYTAYLTWCEAHKECNRLRFADIMIKPLQRCTKYSLLLRNVIKTVENEHERIHASKLLKEIQNFISRVDNSVRYKQECSKFELAIGSIEGYDVFSKEDTDQFLIQHLDLNIRSPMPGCDEKYQRFLIMSGDVKIKDSLDLKADVKVFLFTDYLLICGSSKAKKKYNEKTMYRVIRQKYMVDKLKFYPIRDHTVKCDKYATTIHFIVLDDTGTATTRFSFIESKNSDLYDWEVAMYEAKYTLHIIRLLKTIPNFDVSKYNPCDYNIEPPPTTNSSNNVVSNSIKRVQCQQTGIFHNIRPDSPEQYGTLSEDERKGSDSKSPGKISNSTKGGKSVGSSRASRVSSFQQSQSGSTEYTESRRMISADTSVDRRTISMSSDEYVLPTMQNLEVEDQKTIRSRTTQGWSNRLSTTNHRDPNSLSVNIPESILFGQSMPDLAQDDGATTSSVIVIPSTNLNVPTEQGRSMYLRAGSPSGALGPDNRGISYPPPSPRASLRRGLAFSQTPKNPLIKSRHISREGSSATLPQGSPKIEKLPSKLPAHINDPIPPVVQAINFKIIDDCLRLSAVSGDINALDNGSKDKIDKDY